MIPSSIFGGDGFLTGGFFAAVKNVCSGVFKNNLCSFSLNDWVIAKIIKKRTIIRWIVSLNPPIELIAG